MKSRLRSRIIHARCNSSRPDQWQVQSLLLFEKAAGYVFHTLNHSFRDPSFSPCSDSQEIGGCCHSQQELSTISIRDPGCTVSSGRRFSYCSVVWNAQLHSCTVKEKLRPLVIGPPSVNARSSSFKRSLISRTWDLEPHSLYVKLCTL